MNKAQYLVGKGFPAGLAEMEINIKGRTANGLYHIGVAVRPGRVKRCRPPSRGRGDGLALSAGAVAPLRGGDGAGDRHAGVVGHRLSFHHSSKLIHVSAILPPTLEWGKGNVLVPPLRTVHKPPDCKAFQPLNVHACGVPVRWQLSFSGAHWRRTRHSICPDWSAARTSPRTRHRAAPVLGGARRHTTPCLLAGRRRGTIYRPGNR